MKFEYKQFGRIFTDREENIAKIKEIIKEIDSYEAEYLPNDLITVFDNNKKEFQCTYVGKFDELDLDLLVEKCNKAGIVCGYVKAKYDDEFNDYYLEQRSLAKCINIFYFQKFWNEKDVLTYYGLEYLM